MRAVVVALALFVAVAAASPLAASEYRTLFAKWVSEHKGADFRYETVEEELTRFAVWQANMDIIIKHNMQNKSWTLAMNQFGDMTNEEFTAQYNNYVPAPASTGTCQYQVTSRHAHSLPASVDWTTKNAVTPVKNQGQCGSCWSFSTTGSVEGAWALAKGQLISLSEQELVDCSGAYGNQGCNGGEMQAAMAWIINNSGICTEASYPYTAADGTCNEANCQSVVTISGCYTVPYSSPQTDETGLQTAVAQQPTSVAVDASGSDWQFYSGGIVNDPNCYNSLDHGVLAVGYGTQNGQAYWLVKNSWGASWGNAGYIMLARNAGIDGGECGITRDASYPIV